MRVGFTDAFFQIATAFYITFNTEGLLYRTFLKSKCGIREISHPVKSISLPAWGPWHYKFSALPHLITRTYQNWVMFWSFLIHPSHSFPLIINKLILKARCMYIRRNFSRSDVNSFPTSTDSSWSNRLYHDLANISPGILRFKKKGETGLPLSPEDQRTVERLDCNK